ncbi:hypothetical protein ABZ635_17515 [Nocardiopsis sp. NPDC007018]|uniref:hypothetical protein n=1 Tax=Nocardiopsis sp. NPDC007018 TaxID=3155721 RepID=UPI0033EBAB81
MRRIRPETLEDRDGELRQMADFCTRAVPADAPEHERWLWWQGPAWSGKTALMSWCALDPPPGVTVVSFFVTARFEGQSDRSAFAEEVLHQLSDIAGEPFPTHVRAGNREAYLHQYLDLAAHRCRSRGERLVLVLDGLDEDRGMTAGPDAHSIASVLPARLPVETCVIVSGRLNPPLPGDVPDDHPLRDARVVRPLRPSPRAEVIRNEANRELKYLLEGEAERDLLGFVAAAGGGLSEEDLAELTDLAPARLRDLLSAVTGRSFSRRSHSYVHRAEPEVLILGHEELQRAVVDHLGARRLADHRRRLHLWADQWRRRGWPESTPGYLLRGYFRLLEATGDTERAVALALDQKRSERLIQVTGGTHEARTEILAAQHRVAGGDAVDLVAMLRLTLAYQQVSRLLYVPEGLPCLWVRLGEPERAIALALSATSEMEPSRFLAEVGHALVDHGDRARAARVTRQIENTARTARSSLDRRFCLIDAIHLRLRLGDPDRALPLLDEIRDRKGRVKALGLIASALVENGEERRGARVMERARALVEAASTTTDRVGLITELAEALVGVDDRNDVPDPAGRERAMALAREAEHLAWDLPRSVARTASLSNVLRLHLTLRDQDAADALHSRMGKAVTPWALTAMVRSRISRHELEHAEATARASEEDRRSDLVLVALAYVQEGDWHSAAAVAHDVKDVEAQAFVWQLLAVVAHTGAAAPEASASALARLRALADRDGGADGPGTFLPLHTALVALDLPLPRAPRIAEAQARAPESLHLMEILGALLDHLVAHGLATRAESIVDLFVDDLDRAYLLGRVAAELHGRGETRRARSVAARAESLAWSTLTPVPSTLRLLEQVARVAAPAPERASALADHLETLLHRMDDAGGLPAATSLVERWRQLARTGPRETSAEPPSARTGEGSPTTAEALVPAHLRQARTHLVEVLRASSEAADARRVRAVLAALDSLAVFPEARFHSGEEDRLRVVALARSGDVAGAYALAYRQADETRSKALGLEVARAGDLGPLRDLPSDGGHAHEWLHLLACTAKGLAVLGERERAADLVEEVEERCAEVDHGSWHDRILAVAAEALGHLGETARAEDVLSRVPDSRGKGEALLSISAGAPADRRRRLVARALTTESWEKALPATLELEPELVTALLDDLVAHLDAAGP